MAVPGVVWGIQFERDRTLVVLSHVAVGYALMGVLALWRLVAG